MITILKMGKLPKEEKMFTATCDDCETEFTCGESDLTRVYDPVEEVFVYKINCPICHHSIYIDKD